MGKENNESKIKKQTCSNCEKEFNCFYTATGVRRLCYDCRTLNQRKK